MAAKSGAGASISSGASFQARAGAYALVAAICKTEIELTKGQAIESFSFETTQDIDDININLKASGAAYIQAKAKIDYSISDGGELYSVLEQFERQSRAIAPGDRYVLATSSRSSRKIIFDMRAALEAFRSGDEVRFNKDQPKDLVNIIKDIIRVIMELKLAAGLVADRSLCIEVIHRIYVHVLDVEANDPLEQAAILLLQSQHFAAPSALWGKIVSDCVTYSKERRTISVAEAESLYSRFRSAAGELPEPAVDDLIKIEFGQLNVAVGREVVLGWLPSEQENKEPQLAIIELRRFDEHCNECIKFEDGKCILGHDLEIDVIWRAATHVGMQRMIERDPSIKERGPIIFIPFEGEDDLEKGLCAETHRTKIRQSVLANPHLMRCLHCGRPVSSLSASMVETGSSGELSAGLTHQECLTPDDRVLGTIKSEFFEQYPELINFDPNAWFKSAYNGQRAFNNAELLSNRDKIMGWGGKISSAEPGRYVVEILLMDGSKEIMTVRNGVHRLSKPEADQFVADLNQMISERTSGDQLCYTDESRSFGPKSILLQTFGGKEKIIPVERARTQAYNEKFAARYSRPGSWYAPLLYLRTIDDGRPFRILASVALITNPLKLENFLSNWREAGVVLPEYEIVSLLTDSQFDDFMVEIFGQKLSVVVDPFLESATSTKLLSGISIRSIAAMRKRKF